MAKNTKVISLIQHRRGKLSELPTQLNEAEFGFSTDTNELFIGNPNQEELKNRIETNTFPWGNVQVLTEFTDNLQLIKYSYTGNGNNSLPINIVGTKDNPNLIKNTSFLINGVEIFLENSTSLAELVDIINKKEGLNVKAYISNNTRLGLITTDSSLSLEDKISVGEGIVSRLGFSNESVYSESAATISSRDLQDVLDDNCSIKNFGAIGDGQADDSSIIYNAIISTYMNGDTYKTINFPSGVYKVSTQSLALPYGTHLKGEGSGRTIIKVDNLLNSVINTMDSNYALAPNNKYGLEAELPKYITVEDMTIDISEAPTSTLMTIGSSKNVLFRDVEFIGNPHSNLVVLEKSQYADKIQNVTFEDCIFNTADNAIKTNADIENIVVKNCSFEHITGYSHLYNGTIINGIIDGNNYDDCGALSKDIILLGENTQYVSAINNKFDDSVTKYENQIKPYESKSSLNYSDIYDANLDTKRILQFRFTQPMWEYIDYLMNPNGEYLIKPHYNSLDLGSENISKLTNGLILEQGEESNNNTVTLGGSNPSGNVNINAGAYGNLYLGKDIDASTFEYWDYDINYKEEDRVRYNTETKNGIEIYKCIQDHLSSSNNNPTNASYWLLEGVYNPKIIAEKPIDLNNNYVENSEGNIIFKVSNDTIIAVEDVNPTVPYEERIPAKNDALANVGYVNKMAQTTIRRKINYNNLKENQHELIYFDPVAYGDFINLNHVSINVRAPYYSILPKISSAINWQENLHFYKGDVVNVQTEDPTSSTYQMYVSDGSQWTAITPIVVTKDQLDGDGTPIQSIGNNDDYAVYDNTDTAGLHIFNFYVKKENNWYFVDTNESEWKEFYPSFAKGTKNEPLKLNSVMEINGRQITLTSTSLESVVSQINDIFVDGSVVASIEDGFLKLYQPKGLLVYDDVNFSPFEKLGFDFNEYYGRYMTESVSFIKTARDEYTPSVFVKGSVWVKLKGKNTNYICSVDHISTSFEVDAGMTGGTVKWNELYKQGIEKESQQIVTIPDVKYVSIMAENKIDAARLLFNRQSIDISRRNINSVYEKDWVKNTSYKPGQRVLFENRYWECNVAHTSKDAYDFHKDNGSKTYWTPVAEEGFNYHFDFESNLYNLDLDTHEIINNGELLEEYNFSNYHLYLEFYDANGNLIPVFQPNDDEKSEEKYQVQVSPNGTILLTIQYIRGTGDED